MLPSAAPPPATGSPAQRGDRGFTIFWFAVFLVLSLGFIALAVDVAKLTATRTQLQNAADAAALAGASAVDSNTGQLNFRTAVARAQETGSLNKAFVLSPENIVVDASQVVLQDPNTIQVTVNRAGGNSIVTHFAQVLGVPALQVRATAVARAEPSSSIQCVLPIGVVLSPGESFSPGCGNNYTLKNGPGKGSRGNYGYLALPECPGSNCDMSPGSPHQIACQISSGYCCGMAIGDLVNTAPGTKAPALDGIDSRFANDSDPRENICYSDYNGNGKRIVTVPVLESLPNGAGSATVQGFASFFLRARPDQKNGELVGEFIYISTAGVGGGKPSAGAVTYSAHLVR